MDSVQRLLLDYLRDAARDPARAAQHLEGLPGSFEEFGKELRRFCEHVHQTGELARALSKGDLDISLPPPSNEMAAPLKSLHATLRHLTWQTQRVAQRDYEQRVDFMGDFSRAFNTMTEHLQRQHIALLRELESRQRQITALSQNRSLYELLVGQIQQSIIVADADNGEYLFISRESTLSHVAAEKKLRRWMIRQMQETHDQAGMRTAELELSIEDNVYYYSVSIHPLHWKNRNAFAFVLTDVSREREQLNTLQNIANFDTLTQTYSRRYGMDMIRDWMADKREFSLAFVDIDNLKHVNDRYGHTEGDQYIMLIANKLREFADDAVVCRIGGDEFMVLAPDWDATSARKRFEELRSSLADQKGPYVYSMSYGVVSVKRDGSYAVSDLLTIADERMYEYKRAYNRKHSQ